MNRETDKVGGNKQGGQTEKLTRGWGQTEKQTEIKTDIQGDILAFKVRFGI